MKSKLDRLNDAFAESTQGEWAPVSAFVDNGPNKTMIHVHAWGGPNIAEAFKQGDAEFIALAHNLIPDLLEAVRLLNDFYDRAVGAGWHPDNSPMRGYRDLMEKLK